MRPRRIRKLLSGALGLIVLGFLWFYLAPTPLGGSTSYVVTHGISMEPRFHTGDLAIVRGQSSYHVGEIVAYHNNMLHTIVLHRIIGREGNRYLFKGDNNNFVDPEHPLASQLIGSLRVHIPGLGIRLQSIRSPAVMGLLLFFGVLILTGGVFTQRRRLRRRQRRTGEDTTHKPRNLPSSPASPVRGVLAVGLLALLPFIVLALIAFTRPSKTLRPFTIPYKQAGALSYSANSSPGPVYPGNVAVTGDPLFTHVISAVDLRFSYLFHTRAKHSLSGKASLSVAIASTNGWKRTLPLGEPTYFRGDHALVTATLDLASLLALMQRIETVTSANSSFSFTVEPNVTTTGSIERVPLHSTFSPEVRFTFSEVEAQPVVSEPGSITAARKPTHPFAPSAGGSVTGTRPQPVFVSLGVARLSVGTARMIAISAIAIILGALLATLALIRPMLASVRPPRHDGSESILAKYGGLIVPVARVRPIPGVAVIDVADMEALVRIAEHYDRSILYEATERGQAFWVTDESGQFRYALGASTQPVSDRAQAVPPGPLDTLASDVYADEVGFLGGAPVAPERQPAGVGATSDPVTEQQWLAPSVEQGAQEAPAPAGEALRAGEAAPDASRAQVRAAFASTTGLRWTSDS